MSEPASHKLTSGPRPRYNGQPLGEIARSDEGLAYLRWLAFGHGEIPAVERAIIREYLAALRARKSPPPPAESAPPPPRPRQPSVGTKRRP